MLTRTQIENSFTEQFYAVIKIKNILIIFSLLTAIASNFSNAAEDKIELETTRIQANEELPQILYLVPWKDVTGGNEAEQKLVLHDFFGDLYDPVLPSQLPPDNKATESTSK